MANACPPPDCPHTPPPCSGAVPTSWLSSTPLNMVWQAYCTSLAQAPLATKAATGVVGTFLGDLIAQFSAFYNHAAAAAASSRPGSRRGSSDGGARRRGRGGDGRGVFEYDGARCARLVAFSALIGTPLSHYWWAPFRRGPGRARSCGRRAQPCHASPQLALPARRHRRPPPFSYATARALPRYELLDATVFPATPTSPIAVAAKVLLDQGLQTPFGMLLFFTSLKVFEGKPAQAVPEVRQKVRLWSITGVGAGCG
jgi:hypothetical protein